MVKFILGMVAGITLLAAALTVFGKPTEVHFGSSDEKLLEKIDLALAMAIRGLDQAHKDHAAQLQRDVAEAEILTRIEERLNRGRILGSGVSDDLTAPSPEPEDGARVERLERAALLTQSLLTGDHRTKKLLSHRDWYANWDELYSLLEPLMSASDREEIEQKAAKAKAFELELQKIKKEAESKTIIEDGAALRPLVRSYITSSTYTPSASLHEATMRSLPPRPYPPGLYPWMLRR